MRYPSCLDLYLDLIRHADDAVSREAALVLRHLISKHRVTGDAAWLVDVEAFLVPQPDLAAHGVLPVKDLALSEAEILALSDEVFRRVVAGVSPAWRYAYVLKDAGGFPDLDAAIADHIRTHWRADEAVALHLMYPLWQHETRVALLETYDRMAVEAQNEQMRYQAQNQADVTRQIIAHRADHPEN